MIFQKYDSFQSYIETYIDQTRLNSTKYVHLPITIIYNLFLI